MKILALDLGDKWIGTALSDPQGIFAFPYQTIAPSSLDSFLQETIKKHALQTIVLGYPKTMGGTESDQTRKAIAQKEDLEKKFPEITWIFWDERLSSKRAASTKKAKTKEDKIKSHSIAAAFILESYLQFAQTKLD